METARAGHPAFDSGGDLARRVARVEIDLKALEKGLSVPLSATELSDTLSDMTNAIKVASWETLGDTAPRDVAAVVFVGGSSLMGTVTQGMTDLFPQAQQMRAQAFTAVSDGLAMAAARLT